MAGQDIVYRTSDGEALRYADSPCDFANDGSFDGGTETVLSGYTAQRLTPDFVWNWNGSSFDQGAAVPDWS